jgi:predicted ArsR family transcriptional regulator
LSSKNLAFRVDFSLFFSDNLNMEGLTIKEMAEILGIDPMAVKQRLFVAKIKPMTKDAVYDRTALEAIRNVPGKGRPRKNNKK